MSEITREFITALASKMGGSLVEDPDEPTLRLPGIRFEAPRCILRLRSCWQPRGKWHAYILDHQGHTVHGSESANFTPSRPLPDIAADLRRRVLVPSRAAIIKQASAQASKSVAKQKLQERVERLEAVFGVANNIEGYHHNHFVKLPQFRIASEYHLSGDSRFGRYTAEISVDSFDCLLMIARLVAEDYHVKKGSSS